MLLGRTWTALIIGQVAFVVALLPTAVYVSTETIRHGIQDPGFATDEYLTALLYMERDAEEERQSAAQSDAYRAEFGAHYGDRLTELLRRLRAERDVRAATYASTVPGREGPMWIEIEDQTEAGTADGLPQSERYGLEARYARVDVDFFAAFDVPILAGRSFIRTDADTTASAVIVNRSFVQQFLGDANALGRRFRRAGLSRETRSDAELYRWFEIVGVVPDFPNATEPDEAAAVVYQAASPDQIYPARLAVRMREGSPASFTGRLTQVTSALDLALQLRIVRPLDTIYAEDQKTMRWIGVGIAVVILSVLLLCAAGISAMTSFTVSRRRREIGIRAALGAYPRRLLANMFAGVAVRLSLGVGVGLGASLLLDVLMDGEMLFGNRSLLFVAVSAIMVIVGLLATIGPARRGLRIQPTEALRQE